MKKTVRKRKLKKVRVFMVFFLFSCFLFSAFYSYFRPDSQNSLEVLEKRKWSINDEFFQNGERSLYDTITYLSSYDERLLVVLDHLEEYPEILLQMLVRNPDLTEYVLGYVDHYGKVFSSDVGPVEKGVVPLLLQYDKRWGYGIYGDSVIAINGCGPTSLAMVVSSLTGSNQYTPFVIAQYANVKGYYSDVGTSWSLMSEGGEKFGVRGFEIPLSKNRIFQELAKGHPIICSMRKGDFTTTGHFIVLTGIQDGKIKVNDSNSIERSSVLWEYERLEYQIKNLWAFEPLT